MDGMRRMPPNRSFEMKKVVVFTGAGVSADSGLSTFRDADGLWADYRIEDVCTPEALARNRRLVIEFYNKRRREMLAAEPNAGHRAIAELERDFEVEVLTQNVDNLHERAGSSRVTHLHGELIRLRSSRDSGLIVPIEGWEQRLDATAPDGSLLRPHEANSVSDRTKIVISCFMRKMVFRGTVTKVTKIFSIWPKISIFEGCMRERGHTATN